VAVLAVHVDGQQIALEQQLSAFIHQRESIDPALQ
jgi:hypothetical protein